MLVVPLSCDFMDSGLSDGLKDQHMVANYMFLLTCQVNVTN